MKRWAAGSPPVPVTEFEGNWVTFEVLNEDYNASRIAIMLLTHFFFL